MARIPFEDEEIIGDSEEEYIRQSSPAHDAPNGSLSRCNEIEVSSSVVYSDFLPKVALDRISSISNFTPSVPFTLTSIDETPIPRPRLSPPSSANKLVSPLVTEDMDVVHAKKPRPRPRPKVKKAIESDIEMDKSSDPNPSSLTFFPLPRAEVTVLLPAPIRRPVPLKSTPENITIFSSDQEVDDISLVAPVVKRRKISAVELATKRSKAKPLRFVDSECSGDDDPLLLISPRKLLSGSEKKIEAGPSISCVDANREVPETAAPKKKKKKKVRKESFDHPPGNDLATRGAERLGEFTSKPSKIKKAPASKDTSNDAGPKTGQPFKSKEFIDDSDEDFPAGEQSKAVYASNKRKPDEIEPERPLKRSSMGPLETSEIALTPALVPGKVLPDGELPSTTSGAAGKPKKEKKKDKKNKEKKHRIKSKDLVEPLPDAGDNIRVDSDLDSGLVEAPSRAEPTEELLVSPAVIPSPILPPQVANIKLAQRESSSTPLLGRVKESGSIPYWRRPNKPLTELLKQSTPGSSARPSGLHKSKRMVSLHLFRKPPPPPLPPMPKKRSTAKQGNGSDSDGDDETPKVRLKRLEAEFESLEGVDSKASNARRKEITEEMDRILS